MFRYRWWQINPIIRETISKIFDIPWCRVHEIFLTNFYSDYAVFWKRGWRVTNYFNSRGETGRKRRLSRININIEILAAARSVPFERVTKVIAVDSDYVKRFQFEAISWARRKRDSICCFTILASRGSGCVTLGYDRYAANTEHRPPTASTGHPVLIRNSTSVYTRFIRYFEFGSCPVLSSFVSQGLYSRDAARNQGHDYCEQPNRNWISIFRCTFGSERKYSNVMHTSRKDTKTGKFSL